jgi:hypothetical protein
MSTHEGNASDRSIRNVFDIGHRETIALETRQQITSKELVPTGLGKGTIQSEAPDLWL